MPEILYKAGQQSSDDPWEFVLSTPRKDSYGDVVEADWILTDFRRNPIALWMHHSAQPIGVWERIRLEGDVLRARLVLAAAGTSQLVDELRGFVEQRILRACSVGFHPGKAEPLDPEKPWAGYRLSKNRLVEASLVSVPANADALNTTKSMFFCPQGTRRCDKGAWTQLRDSSGIIVPKTMNGGTAMPTLAERIQAQEQTLAKMRSETDELMQRADANGILPDDEQTKLDDLTEQMERVQRTLATLQRQEQIRAGQAAGSGQRPTGDAPAAPRIDTRLAREDKPALGVARAVACFLRGMRTHTDPVVLAERVYPDDAAVAKIVRAASAPADASTATWAANLVTQEWGPFWALVRDRSIFGQVPGRRIEVMSLTNMPVQAGRGTLAAGFTAAGTPIKVKKGNIGTSTVTPNKLAVISAYLNELIERQTVEEIAMIVRDQMIGDTVETVDTVLLSDTARVAGTTPAGVQDATEAGAANVVACTNVATGAGNATDLEILADVAALLSRVNAIAVNAGVWVMHPNQVRALRRKVNAATGHFTFAADIKAGVFEGFPIISSTNATAGVVSFFGDDCMVFANELAPRFAESKDATLHFEDSLPLAIGTADSPATVAAPTRSAFQEDFTALRMTAFMDWRIVRQAGVQTLTGATAW